MAHLHSAARALAFKSESVFSIINKSWQRFFSLSFVPRCYNNFHQRQNATNISVFLSHSETLNCENKLAMQGVLIIQQIKSRNLHSSFEERVIVNFGDYFCCIHIFSAKLLICSQTFVNRKYIQKLEISYEFDVTNVRRFYWLYKTLIGGFSYWSTTDTLLAFYTNKTRQHLQK